MSETRSRAREQWLKVQAMHVVAMLPEDTAEAKRVLAYARQVVDEFLADEKEAPRPLAVVQPLHGAH
jgi:hypothetical protein